jgi:hypothetical protein
MKKLLLSISYIFVCISGFAQSGGPDTYGYTWRDNTHPQGPVYDWINITNLPGATQVTGLADDNTSATYPIGFNFPYYWYSVSDFKVGSNGYIIFNNGALSSQFPSIPSQALPNDFIAPFMADLNFGDSGNVAECWYWTNNVDTLIVSFINVPFWINDSITPYRGSNTFQVVLSAADSSITFNYATQMDTSTGSGTFLSIGIENNSGVIGLQHSTNTYPVPPYSVKYYYPDTANIIVSDAATIYGNNVESGAIFLSKNGNSFAMNSRIGNTGNQTLDTVPVTMSIYNSTGTVILQDHDTAFSLAPQQTQDFSSPILLPAAVADVYSFITQTNLQSDFTAANDIKKVKVTVVDTNQTLIPLGYTGPIANPVGEGISWNGGDAGVGVEIIPPFYPCYVHKLEYFISTNPAPSAFAGLIYDNQGVNGGPGNLLDSVFFPADSIDVLAWNTEVLQNPIRIDSGSVFVEWLMVGEGIQVGSDTTGPVSNRSYEILGGWSILRYRETRDPMIRIQISSMQVTGEKKIEQNDFAGNFYPSPSNNRISIDVNGNLTSKNVRIDFFDMRGQLIKTETQSGGRNIYSFDVSSFANGIYLCKISSGEQVVNRKVIVSR